MKIKQNSNQALAIVLTLESHKCIFHITSIVLVCVCTCGRSPQNIIQKCHAGSVFCHFMVYCDCLVLDEQQQQINSHNENVYLSEVVYKYKYVSMSLALKILSGFGVFLQFLHVFTFYFIQFP